MFNFKAEDLHQYDMVSSGRLDNLTDKTPRSPRASPRSSTRKVVGATGIVGIRHVQAPESPMSPLARSRTLNAATSSKKSTSSPSKMSALRHLVQTSAPVALGSTNDSKDTAVQDISEVLLSLRTGEDAIAFFARVGTDSSVKFLHLKRPSKRPTAGIGYRPYDLEVVLTGLVAGIEFPPLSHQIMQGEYFTMSVAGVVHIRPHTPSEFIPLSEWMRQSTIFNVLSNIRFFKYYLVFKLFHRWRQCVRYNLYCAQRRRLQARLFLSKPTFAPAVMDVNELAFAFRRVPLLDMSASGGKTSQSADIGQFTEHQVEGRGNVQWGSLS